MHRPDDANFRSLRHKDDDDSAIFGLSHLCLFRRHRVGRACGNESKRASRSGTAQCTDHICGTFTRQRDILATVTVESSRMADDEHGPRGGHAVANLVDALECRAIETRRDGVEIDRCDRGDFVPDAQLGDVLSNDGRSQRPQDLTCLGIYHCRDTTTFIKENQLGITGQTHIGSTCLHIQDSCLARGQNRNGGVGCNLHRWCRVDPWVGAGNAGCCTRINVTRIVACRRRRCGSSCSGGP